MQMCIKRVKTTTKIPITEQNKQTQRTRALHSLAMAPSSYLFLFAALGHIVPGGWAATVVVDWQVQRGIIPGTAKVGILVNPDTWPAPPIEANVGDTIIVNVNNVGVDEGLTLHAHGFHQQNNNQHDGPSGITQW